MQKRRSKSARPPTFSPEIIPGVDIKAWRQNASLVTSARAVLSSAQFPQMLEVLRRASPAFDVLPLDAIPHARIALQCRSEGWNEALKQLQSLGDPWGEPEIVPETFQPENFEESQT